MKKFFLSLLFMIIAIFIISCKKEEANNQNNSNQNNNNNSNGQNFITTVRAKFTPLRSGNVKELIWKDIDGVGGTPPIITNNGDTLFGINAYALDLTFLNENVNPPLDKTIEILNNGKDYQVFFQPDSSLDLSIGYADYDSSRKPIGISTIIVKDSFYISSGNLKIILRHQPNKAGVNVHNGDITNAGGNTEVQADFFLNIY